ncbi:MAG: CHASE2 domain-containing protein, partial [Prochlorotrichaceae cyanobacterium]
SLLPLLLMSGVVTAIVLLLESLGGLELLELQLFDRAMRSRPPAAPDDRLLVVGLREADLRAYGVPLPDEILARVLQRLQAGGAKVIGLDLYRDLPQPPGTEDLYEQFQAENLVGILQLGQDQGEWIDPPPLLPAQQIGFNDLPFDLDSVVRRGLLFGTDGEQTYQAFAFRLARYYLRDQGIRPQRLEQPPEGIAWGATTLTPLPRHAGGYARMDDRGYQILLDYRSLESVAPIVTVQELLSGQVSPDLIHDRIVLIGSLAPSQKDIFLTPYSLSDPESAGISGVIVHAHFTQQLLDLALGTRSSFYFLSPALEGLWLGFWTLLGGLLFYPRYGLWRSVVGAGASLILLWGSQFSLLQFSVWVPLISPSLGLGLGVVMGLLYSRYRLWNLHQSLLDRVQQQTEAIADLQALKQLPPAPQYAPTTLPEDEEIHLAALTAKVISPQQNTVQPYALTTLPEGEALNMNPSDVLPSADPLGLPQGEILGGRYRFQQILGQGGFGVTYLARDQQRPEQPKCVIKQLFPARRDPHFLKAAHRLFQLEARILESLGREHDRIPQLLAYFEEDQRFYLVQDFIEGHPFSEELGSGTPFSIAAVVDLLLEVLPTLKFIHRHQLIHRDLKPSNLIRRADGAVVVIDFGAVKHFSEISENTTLALGTPGYMAPEQIAGLPRLNSDLYALGIIAIECLTATPPQEWINDPETGDLHWQPLLQSQHGHEAHLDEFVGLLSRLVERSASDRYPSADAALKVFKKFKKSLSISTVT